MLEVGIFTDLSKMYGYREISKNKKRAQRMRCNLQFLIKYPHKNKSANLLRFADLFLHDDIGTMALAR
jgi:hypothetical protein